VGKLLYCKDLIMSRPNFKGPKLPKGLLDQIQPGTGQQNGSSHRKGKNFGKSLPRKEQRKQVRQQKKVARTQSFRSERPAIRNDEMGQSGESDFGDFDDEELQDDLDDRATKRRKLEDMSIVKPKVAKKSFSTSLVANSKIAEEMPKSIEKVPRAVREALEQDDAEIAFLEKKLGVRKKSKDKAQRTGEGGLADLLGGIDDMLGIEDEDDREDREWLKSKRNRAGNGLDSDMTDEESEDDELDGPFETEGSEDYAHTDEDEAESDKGSYWSDGTDFDDEEEELESEDELPTQRVRENPYKPPIQDSSPAKYVPPSLRTTSKSDEETLARVRRQLQGLLNRLSEANILSILKDVEGVLSSNPRQYVITSLIDLLMGLICDRSVLLDTFIILHSGFIAALYKIIGSHFGAQLLERLVSDFNKFYEEQKTGHTPAKETSNLIALLSDIYTFQVVSCNIVFDLIKLLLQDLTDLNAELLLRLVKSCGPQLRHDSPAALKDTVILVQRAVAEKGEANLPVRTKFMVEMIMNLKNNRVKNIGSVVVTEAIVRMKKALGTLNTRNIKGTEPLGIGLRDIERADKGGKWWLVGASWSNEDADKNENSEPMEEPIQSDGGSIDDETREGDFNTTALVQMAKQQGMNTEIRRKIFVCIMSSSDYQDAYLRLRRLGLNKAQQYEIPRVLIHCAGSEEVYNPYYRLIAEKMCGDHKFRMAFQFNLWSIFQRLGETDMRGDSEFMEAEERDIDLREIVSCAKFYGELIASLSLPISILKVSLLFNSSLSFRSLINKIDPQPHASPTKDQYLPRSHVLYCFPER
jgi:nucleolar MIF4G domain-containing protein 1